MFRRWRFALHNCHYGLFVKSSNRISRRNLTSQSHDPLRILFCGSDAFSIASLEALYGIHRINKGLIESIDVVSRPPKPYGRGLKKIREVPIADAARKLSLPLHQIDTFRGWEPPHLHGNINLVVAVSFGLLVPPRIIDGAKYGGLNVHPSLLPKYRGAAPIHWTLINGDAQTGMTLQTLHPTKMDHGRILMQTQPLDIYNSERSSGHRGLIPEDFTSVAELTNALAPIGADLLKRYISQRRFELSSELAPPCLTQEVDILPLAQKIKPEDRRIRWTEWSVDHILRRNRVIGPLWNQTYDPSTRESFRIIWTEGFSVAPDTCVPEGAAKVADVFTLPKGRSVFVVTKDHVILEARKVKVEGQKEQDAAIALRKFIQSNNVEQKAQLPISVLLQ